ncbi:hypothetical protein D3C85_454760 [compost metagenome]
MSDVKQSREGLILRVLWMILFALVWQVAELVLLALVLVQLVYRLTSGRPHVGAMNFGDSLSQYVAQIGRFGCFHSDEKPWPFADWPTPREPQGEGAEAVRAAAWSAAAAPAAAAAPSAAPVQDAAAAEPAPAAVSAPAASETTVEPAAQDDSAEKGKDETGPDATAEPKV